MKDLNLLLVRVDPIKRAVVPFKSVVGRNAIDMLKRQCGTNVLGHRVIMEIDAVRLKGPDPSPAAKLQKGGPQEIDLGPMPLMVCAGADLDYDVPGWRLRGGDTTNGVSVLFGRGAGGGMVNCPVTKFWLDERIEWMPGETPEERTSRAHDAVDLMQQDLKDVIINAFISPSTTKMYIERSANDDQVGACLRLGITTAESGGRELGPFGQCVRGILIS